MSGIATRGEYDGDLFHQVAKVKYANYHLRRVRWTSRHFYSIKKKTTFAPRQGFQVDYARTWEESDSFRKISNLFWFPCEFVVLTFRALPSCPRGTSRQFVHSKWNTVNPAYKPWAHTTS